MEKEEEKEVVVVGRASWWLSAKETGRRRDWGERPWPTIDGPKDQQCFSTLQLQVPYGGMPDATTVVTRNGAYTSAGWRAPATQ
jgi:hypothetical protein